MNTLKEMQCTRAGYFYLGHYRAGFLEVLLESYSHGIGVSFNPKINDTFNMYSLFKVFGLDPEDGKYINELEGRRCRVEFDKNNRVSKVFHLTNDKIFYEVKRED